MNATDPLAALRPLHAPAPISWWPPAPGWWLLLVIGLLLVLLGVWWWKRNAVKRAALRELKQMQTLHEEPAQLLAAVNRLLKRYALVCWPASQAAGLTGQAWLEFLDAHGGKGDFAKGPGQLLLTQPYASSSAHQTSAIDPHAESIIPMARRWIRGNRPGSGR